VGGGSFPERDLPTTLVRVTAAGVRADTLREALLATDPPLIGRIEDEAFCLDPRTVAKDEYGVVSGALEQALDMAGPAGAAGPCAE
jgi:L-seryl-tRNA(Ser) seleniumtransferase